VRGIVSPGFFPISGIDGVNVNPIEGLLWDVELEQVRLTRDAAQTMDSIKGDA